MRWLRLFTPVTYLCMLPGFRLLAAFPQLKLFRKNFLSYFELWMRWLRSLTPITYLCMLPGIRLLAAFPRLKLFRKTFHISGEPASGKDHILLPYHPISGGRLGDDGAG
jgi:hypothetical protein